MNRLPSVIVGLLLIGLGLLALTGNIVFSLVGLSAAGWPLIVIVAGLAFVLPPILFSKRRGLSGLFIPGLPILTTGVLLFFANTFNQWDLWAKFWPLEVISLAVGLLLLGLWLGVVWMAIPGFIVGFVGLALQLSALTGHWDWWAVLWTVIPLGLGLAFLLIGLRRRSLVLSILGFSFCGFAVLMAGFMGLVAFSGWHLLGLAAPVLIVLAGVGLVVVSLLRRPAAPVPTA